jgi:2-C-methyl-D-erythritol 4-phosphate cytidylyltransferase
MVAIVVAAGSGSRFGGEKLFSPLAGRPVLGWSLDAFERAPSVDWVVVVLREDNLRRGQALIRRLGYQKVAATCVGGARRQDSVMCGLRHAPTARWVAVQDGARPFITVDLIERGAAVAHQIGAAVAAVPVKDTLKLVASSHLIERSPRRANLWAAQTPQIFQRDQLIAAAQSNAGADATDDAELLERAGMPVGVYLGSYENLKITTPDDLILARLMARQRLRTGKIA